MLKAAVHVIPTIEVIDLKFLEVGHTQMEVDAMHSVIERHKKKMVVFSPVEWPNIVSAAKKKQTVRSTFSAIYGIYGFKKNEKGFYQR